jgi:hypothetical protein
MVLKRKTKTVAQSKLEDKVKEVTEEIKAKNAADDKACMEEVSAVLKKYNRSLEPQIIISGNGQIGSRLLLVKARS